MQDNHDRKSHLKITDTEVTIQVCEKFRSTTNSPKTKQTEIPLHEIIPDHIQQQCSSEDAIEDDKEINFFSNYSDDDMEIFRNKTYTGIIKGVDLLSNASYEEIYINKEFNFNSSGESDDA